MTQYRDNLFDSYETEEREEDWTPNEAVISRQDRITQRATTILRKDGFSYLEDPRRTDGVHTKVSMNAISAAELPLEFEGKRYDRLGHADDLHDVKRAAFDISHLTEGERFVYVTQQQRRKLIEQYGCFARLLKPRTTRGDKLAHLQMWLRNLSRVNGDARDAVAANVDEHLHALGASYSHRCDLLSFVMGCKVSTVRTRIINGRRVLQDAMRQAQGLYDEERSCKRAKSKVQPLLDEISALSPDERGLVARKLVELAAIGEINATDKADRAGRVGMISHSILLKLDALGLNDDKTRRMLARMSSVQQKQWCADTINEAISGTREQRKAARDRCSSEQFAALLREFISSVKSQRRTENVVQASANGAA